MSKQIILAMSERGAAWLRGAIIDSLADVDDEEIVGFLKAVKREIDSQLKTGYRPTPTKTAMALTPSSDKDFVTRVADKMAKAASAAIDDATPNAGQKEEPAT